MTLWLDVEDLFHYAANNRRPSGIQRVSYEIYAELHAMLGDGVRFCRHDPVGNTLRTVPWESLRDLFAGLSAAQPHGARPGAAAPRARFPRLHRLRRLAARLPLGVREPLVLAMAAQRNALVAQIDVLRLGSRAARALPSALRRPAPARGTEAGFDSIDIREAGRPGDVFAILGSPWFHQDYGGFIARVARDRGMRTALLVYDIIPLVRPEWCDRALVRTFGAWFTAFIPKVDMVFAISDATARDVARWSDRSGVPVARPIRTLPMGTGFSGPPPAEADRLPDGLRAGAYVLFVSTIEARKNHLLAFRVWRRMVEELPPEQVPPLVFAGHVGWLVSDLMQQLENCDHLGGKVLVLTDPSDGDLATLYRNCRFTLFPSLYEGWGLPVSEALAFGKPCVASNSTSIPEAGGPFCLYFDPENAAEAYDVVRRACTDDTLLAECAARIEAGFRPASWGATARSLLDQLSA